MTAEQLEWLDELGAAPTGPCSCSATTTCGARPATSGPRHYFGINPDDSEKLVEVFARRPRLVGYFAGHTHRNRVRRFAATGDVPWVEVACVKDFPGAWAEYRVFEGGILQVHRRISSPEALAWTERTRAMFGGLYPQLRLRPPRGPLLPRSSPYVTLRSRPSISPSSRSTPLSPSTTSV